MSTANMQTRAGDTEHKRLICPAYDCSSFYEKTAHKAHDRSKKGEKRMQGIVISIPRISFAHDGIAPFELVVSLYRLSFGHSDRGDEEQSQERTIATRGPCCLDTAF